MLSGDRAIIINDSRASINGHACTVLEAVYGIVSDGEDGYHFIPRLLCVAVDGADRPYNRWIVDVDNLRLISAGT